MRGFSLSGMKGKRAYLYRGRSVGERAGMVGSDESRESGARCDTEGLEVGSMMRSLDLRDEDRGKSECAAINVFVFSCV